MWGLLLLATVLAVGYSANDADFDPDTNVCPWAVDNPAKRADCEKGYKSYDLDDEGQNGTVSRCLTDDEFAKNCMATCNVCGAKCVSSDQGNCACETHADCSVYGYRTQCISNKCMPDNHAAYHEAPRVALNFNAYGHHIAFFNTMVSGSNDYVRITVDMDADFPGIGTQAYETNPEGSPPDLVLLASWKPFDEDDDAEKRHGKLPDWPCDITGNCTDGITRWNLENGVRKGDYIGYCYLKWQGKSPDPVATENIDAYKGLNPNGKLPTGPYPYGYSSEWAKDIGGQQDPNAGGMGNDPNNGMGNDPNNGMGNDPNNGMGFDPNNDPNNFDPNNDPNNFDPNNDPNNFDPNNDPNNPGGLWARLRRLLNYDEPPSYEYSDDSYYDQDPEQFYDESQGDVEFDPSDCAAPSGINANDCILTNTCDMAEMQAEEGDEYTFNLVCYYENDRMCDVPDYCPPGTDLDDCASYDRYGSPLASGAVGSDDDYSYDSNSGSGPTCSDGIQNQGEQGVDCGGPCSPCPGVPTCQDDPSYRDTSDDTCSWYNIDNNAAFCGNYDRAGGLLASDACCACGGGTISGSKDRKLLSEKRKLLSERLSEKRRQLLDRLSEQRRSPAALTPWKFNGIKSRNEPSAIGRNLLQECFDNMPDCPDIVSSIGGSCVGQDFSDFLLEDCRLSCGNCDGSLGGAAVDPDQSQEEEEDRQWEHNDVHGYRVVRMQRVARDGGVTVVMPDSVEPLTNCGFDFRVDADGKRPRAPGIHRDGANKMFFQVVELSARETTRCGKIIAQVFILDASAEWKGLALIIPYMFLLVWSILMSVPWIGKCFRPWEWPCIKKKRDEKQRKKSIDAEEARRRGTRLNKKSFWFINPRPLKSSDDDEPTPDPENPDAEPPTQNRFDLITKVMLKLGFKPKKKTDDRYKKIGKAIKAIVLAHGDLILRTGAVLVKQMFNLSLVFSAVASVFNMDTLVALRAQFVEAFRNIDLKPLYSWFQSWGIMFNWGAAIKDSNCGGVVKLVAPIAFFGGFAILYIVSKSGLVFLCGINLQGRPLNEDPRGFERTFRARYGAFVTTGVVYFLQIVVGSLGSFATRSISSKQSCGDWDRDINMSFGVVFAVISLIISLQLIFSNAAGRKQIIYAPKEYWRKEYDGNEDGTFDPTFVDPWTKSKLAMKLRPLLEKSGDKRENNCKSTFKKLGIMALNFVLNVMNLLQLAFGFWSVDTYKQRQIQDIADKYDPDERDDDDQVDRTISLISKTDALVFLIVPFGAFFTKGAEVFNDHPCPFFIRDKELRGEIFFEGEDPDTVSKLKWVGPMFKWINALINWAMLLFTAISPNGSTFIVLLVTAAVYPIEVYAKKLKDIYAQYKEIAEETIGDELSSAGAALSGAASGVVGEQAGDAAGSAVSDAVQKGAAKATDALPGVAAKIEEKVAEKVEDKVRDKLNLTEEEDDDGTEIPGIELDAGDDDDADGDDGDGDEEDEEEDEGKEWYSKEVAQLKKIFDETPEGTDPDWKELGKKFGATEDEVKEQWEKFKQEA